MLIQRADGEDCQSPLSCSSSDGQPEQPDIQSSDGDYDGPGPHRYIGVVMVVGIVIVAVVLWVRFGAWPKKMLSKQWSRKGRKGTEDIKANGLIDLTASLPSLEKPKRVRIRDNKSDIPEALEPTDGLAASKRAVEQSEPKYGFVPSRQLGEVSTKPP